MRAIHSRYPVIVVIVVGLFGLIAVVVALRPKGSEDLSLLRVKQAGVISFGLDPSYPPFEVVNGAGALDGFDVDLSNELGRRLGVKTKFVAIDFGGIYDALNVGKFDLIVGGITNSADDDPNLAYTREYYDDGLTVVAGPDSSGAVLGIESGSDADLDLATLRPKLTGYTFQQYDDQDQMRAAITSHKLRGAVVDRVTASMWSHDSRELSVGDQNLTSVPYVIGGRRGDGALLQAVDQALQSMIADGFVASLDRKWLGA